MTPRATLTPEETIRRATKLFARAVRYYATADELGSNPSHALGLIEYECKQLRMTLRNQRKRIELRAERAGKGE